MEVPITIANIKASLPKHKKEIDKLDIWVYFAIRPLSFYVTWPFLKLGISSNMATVFCAIVGIIGSFSIISSNLITQLIGAFIINFWIVLDCVDGNIARFNKKSSKYGEFLDGISGYLFTGFLYTAIGISVFNSQQHFSILPEEYKWLYILIGGVTSMATIFPRLVDHKAHTMFSEYKSETTNRKTEYSLFHIIGLNIAGMAGLSNPLLIIAVITRTLDIYLIFYFLIHCLIALYSITKTLKQVPKNI